MSEKSLEDLSKSVSEFKDKLSVPNDWIKKTTLNKLFEYNDIVEANLNKLKTYEKSISTQNPSFITAIKSNLVIPELLAGVKIYAPIKIKSIKDDNFYLKENWKSETFKINKPISELTEYYNYDRIDCTDEPNKTGYMGQCASYASFEKIFNNINPDITLLNNLIYLFTQLEVLVQMGFTDLYEQPYIKAELDKFLAKINFTNVKNDIIKSINDNLLLSSIIKTNMINHINNLSAGNRFIGSLASNWLLFVIMAIILVIIIIAGIYLIFVPIAFFLNYSLQVNMAKKDPTYQFRPWFLVGTSLMGPVYCALWVYKYGFTFIPEHLRIKKKFTV